MAQRNFYARSAWIILAVFALAAPGIFYAAAQAVRSNTNKVEDWLPSSFDETWELNWFRRHFIGDQFVIISWEGCRLGDDPRKSDAEPDDPRIERLARALVPAQESAPGDEAGVSHTKRRFFKSVTTARELLNQLTSEPMNLPYDQAVQRLQGALIGPDGRHTCIVLTLTDEATGNFRQAIGCPRTGPFGLRHFQGELFDVIEECGIDPDIVHLGGPPVDNVAIDEEGERTLIRLASLASLLGLGLAWLSLRSFKLTLIVFACGILSAALGLAAIWLSGGKTDAVVLSMPALVYVLAISGSVHLINYYQDAVDEHGVVGAPERAIEHGWKPTLLCSVTTALGLLSLYASDLTPIRHFGLYSATAMMLMLVVLFLYLPAALQLWPVRTRQRRTSHATLNPSVAAAFSSLESFWEYFGGWIIKRHALVFTACMLFIAAAGFGLTRVRTSIDLMKLFDSEARILRDYQWLEAHVGRLVPMELVVRFSPEVVRNTQSAADQHSGFSIVDRMQVVNDVQRAIAQKFGAVGEDVIGPSMSAVTFVPPLPERRGGTSSVIRRSVINSKLEASYDTLLESGYLKIDTEDNAELWRISLRVAAFQDVDYGRFAQELREVVEPVLQAQRMRRKVLDSITDARQGQTYVGATVVLWEQTSRNGPQRPPANGDPRPLDELAELLQRDRLRVIRRDEDVAAVPLTQLQELQQVDCVVLEKCFSEPDMQMLRGVARKLICLDEEKPRPRRADLHVASAPGENTISAVYTGVVPIVYKAQRALLTSLIDSTTWSFLTITPLLMFVTRGIVAGLVAMLPNVLPVLVIFGGMGWLGLPIDIGSMMSASIALGVAVDDTIHYLTWFREDLNENRNRKRAILAAYRRCATPTLQAALISGLGLSVFAFSTFTPTQQFGYLMLTILLAGVVAELVMLPAILAGPLGVVFRPLRAQPSGSAPPPPHLSRCDKESRCPDASPAPLAGTSPGSGN